MDSDDRPIGRILSRREVIGVLGASGAAMLAACAPGGVLSASPTAVPTTATATTASPGATTAAVAVPSCVVRPALTEGPYFVDEKLNRSDIRIDPTTNQARPGMPLAITFNVARVGTGSCTAFSGAQIDIWHCDALGVYSDATDPSFNTRGQKFLRGYQLTDANGQASFTTIYPGWYQGRAVHVHFKIRSAGANGAVADFTSQLFFDEAVNDAVLSQTPYSQHAASGRLHNSGDGIYQGGGDKLLVKPAQSGGSYSLSFDIGLA